MLVLLTALIFVFTFWYFGIRAGRPQMQYWVLYAIGAGIALRWGIPFLWAIAKPLAVILIGVTIVMVVRSALRRKTSAL